jgi:hypothetical protein
VRYGVITVIPKFPSAEKCLRVRQRKGDDVSEEPWLLSLRQNKTTSSRRQHSPQHWYCNHVPSYTMSRPEDHHLTVILDRTYKNRMWRCQIAKQLRIVPQEGLPYKPCSINGMHFITLADCFYHLDTLNFRYFLKLAVWSERAPKNRTTLTFTVRSWHPARSRHKELAE